MIGERTSSTLLMLVPLVFLVALAAADKFEVIAEKPIPDVTFANGIRGISPDGKSVLRLAEGRLTVRRIDTQEEKELFPKGSLSEVLGAWAAWSADGKRIYYLPGHDRPEFNDLWRLDIASLKKECLIKNARGVTIVKPKPSPDGKSIAFYRGPVMMLAGADGQNERILCEHCDPSYREMVWAPDSTQLLLIPKYQADDPRLRLLTVASGQTRPLAAVDSNLVTSIVWPSWSSGPFVGVLVLQHTLGGGNRLQGGQIWHLSLAANGELTQLTRDAETIYFRLFGVGADGYSLIVQRLPPQPSGWDDFLGFFAKFGLTTPAPQAYPKGWPTTVILTLKK